MDDVGQFTKRGSWYGQAFTVFVWAQRLGEARVTQVIIDGRGTFEDPLSETYDTAEHAIEAGFRFAIDMINH